tara:strand:- start:6755 stop:6964 length:210 start_codon:yes stop_codon:yes gene_type:complete
MDIIDILDNKVEDTLKVNKELKYKLNSLEIKIKDYEDNIQVLKEKNEFYKTELKSVLEELDKVVKDIDI